MSTPNWYSPPAAAPDPAAVLAQSVETSAGAQYARFAIRGGARIVDWVVTAAIGGLGGGAAGLTLGVLSVAGAMAPGWEHRVEETHAVNFVFGLLAALLYHALAEWIGQTTVGKLVFRLRVCDAALGPCTFRGAIVRNLAYYIDALFFGLVAYGSMSRSSLQQRLGDRWGRTVVVKAASLAAPPGAGRIAAGILIGSSTAFLTSFLQGVLSAL